LKKIAWLGVPSFAGILFKNNYWNSNQIEDDEMGEVSIGNWSNAKCVHMLVRKPDGAGGWGAPPLGVVIGQYENGS
jgi:hypothetical protein